MRMPGLPTIRFDTACLPAAQQFEAWREAVGVTHEITSPGRLARDGLDAASDVWRLDQLVVSHRRFPALRFARDAGRARKDGLDHYSLLLMRSGRWVGDVGGREVVVGPGEVCLFDLAQPVDNWVSDNASLRVMAPRELFDAGPTAAAHGEVLRGGAAALLADFLENLRLQLDQLTLAEARHVGAATREMISACLAPSRERAALAAPAIAATLLQRARRRVEESLSDPELTPDRLAQAIGVSRSGLYRLFEPLGGVAAYIQGRRLARIRAHLADPRERRRISDIAFSYGFTNEASFSRAFRRAFGVSASECRALARTGVAPDSAAAEQRQLYRSWVSGA